MPPRHQGPHKTPRRSHKPYEEDALAARRRWRWNPPPDTSLPLREGHHISLCCFVGFVTLGRARTPSKDRGAACQPVTLSLFTTILEGRQRVVPLSALYVFMQRHCGATA
ncbi:MAG: hypothetical protein IJU65_08275 [Desulfovibrio sp.]|nr:hypothetical protein [Desulfovibrio sp.]